MTARELQESLAEALDRPKVPRVWTHAGCGGWVLFSLAGGTCQQCGAGPLEPGQYVKPAAASKAAA